jgi:hypothetical protein
MTNVLVSIDDFGIRLARDALVLSRKRFGKGKASTIRDIRVAACSLSVVTAVVGLWTIPAIVVIAGMNLLVSVAYVKKWQALSEEEDTARGLIAEEKRAAGMYETDRAQRLLMLAAALFIGAMYLLGIATNDSGDLNDHLVSIMLSIYYLIAAATRYLEAAPPPPPAAHRSGIGTGVFAGPRV